MAIDGLGGYSASQDDDQQTKSQIKGVGILYSIFTVLLITGILFVAFMVPETKGKTPEELLMSVDQGRSDDSSETGSGSGSGRDTNSGQFNIL